MGDEIQLKELNPKNFRKIIKREFVVDGNEVKDQIFNPLSLFEGKKIESLMTMTDYGYFFRARLENYHSAQYSNYLRFIYNVPRDYVDNKVMHYFSNDTSGTDITIVACNYSVKGEKFLGIVLLHFEKIPKGLNLHSNITQQEIKEDDQKQYAHSHLIFDADEYQNNIYKIEDGRFQFFFDRKSGVDTISIAKAKNYILDFEIDILWKTKRIYFKIDKEDLIIYNAEKYRTERVIIKNFVTYFKQQRKENIFRINLLYPTTIRFIGEGYLKSRVRKLNPFFTLQNRIDEKYLSYLFGYKPTLKHENSPADISFEDVDERKDKYKFDKYFDIEDKDGILEIGLAHSSDYKWFYKSQSFESLPGKKLKELNFSLKQQSHNGKKINFWVWRPIKFTKDTYFTNVNQIAALKLTTFQPAKHIDKEKKIKFDFYVKDTLGQKEFSTHQISAERNIGPTIDQKTTYVNLEKGRFYPLRTLVSIKDFDGIAKVILPLSNQYIWYEGINEYGEYNFASNFPVISYKGVKSVEVDFNKRYEKHPKDLDKFNIHGGYKNVCLFFVGNLFGRGKQEVKMPVTAIDYYGHETKKDITFSYNTGK